MRNDDLFIVEIDAIKFNGLEFKEIHVPINHINFDENDNKRSNYSIEEIVEMVTSWLDGLFLEPEGKKEERSFYVYYDKTCTEAF